MNSKLVGEYIYDVLVKKVAPRAVQLASSAAAGYVCGPRLQPYLDQIGYHPNQAKVMLAVATVCGTSLGWMGHHVTAWWTKRYAPPATLQTVTATPAPAVEPAVVAPPEPVVPPPPIPPVAPQ